MKPLESRVDKLEAQIEQLVHDKLVLHYLFQMESRIMATLAEQEAQLDEVLDQIKTNQTEMVTRVDALITALENANQNPAVDLTDEIAAAQAISDSLASFEVTPPATT